MNSVKKVIESSILEGIIDLPEELRNRKVEISILPYEDEEESYYNSLGPLGRETFDKGFERGKRQVLSKRIIKMIDEKIGELPGNYREVINNLDFSTLEVLLLDVFDFEKLEDLEKYIPREEI